MMHLCNMESFATEFSWVFFFSNCLKIPFFYPVQGYFFPSDYLDFDFNIIVTSLTQNNPEF